MIEIETVNLLVRLYQHKIDKRDHLDILEYAKWYYPNQDTDSIDYYIKMCLIDVGLEELI